MPLPVNAPQTHVLRETQEEVKKEGEQIRSACALGSVLWASVWTRRWFQPHVPRLSGLSAWLSDHRPSFFGGVKHGDSGCGTEKVHQEGALDGRGRCPEPHRQRGELGRNRRARCMWTQKDGSRPPRPHPAAALLSPSPPPSILFANNWSP